MQESRLFITCGIIVLQSLITSLQQHCSKHYQSYQGDDSERENLEPCFGENAENFECDYHSDNKQNHKNHRIHPFSFSLLYYTHPAADNKSYF